jgi:hypothetical protein
MVGAENTPPVGAATDSLLCLCSYVWAGSVGTLKCRRGALPDTDESSAERRSFRRS